MGFLEYIINTPSHHRVHHGSDPKYLDRNHAGSLIIWDKMFGTFQKEETEPVYGITSPLNSFNPWKANFHYWQELISIAKKSDSIKDKILIFLKPPGWLPASMGGFQKPKEIDYENCQKYDVKLDHTMNVYIFIHFTFILLTSSYFLFFSNSMFNQPSTYTLVGFLSLSVFILFSLYVLGKGLESHSSFKNLEILRLLLLFPIGLAFVQISSLILVATISLSIFALSSLLLYFYVKSDTPVIV
jgi:sterol desaturase/sphingolipid hydroxylase (fatty acid hydroxylase superfamily)